jgi:hypothetical protein
MTGYYPPNPSPIPFSISICYTKAAVQSLDRLISHVSGFVLRAYIIG